jgi:hypothetical protein
MRSDFNNHPIKTGEPIMNITGAGQLQGDGFLLRPIVEDDAGVIASASLSDVPDWTFIPRDLGEDQSRACSGGACLPERAGWQSAL